MERAFECVWYRKRYGAVDRDDDLHAFLVRIAGKDRAREMLPRGARLPWVESFAPKRDQLATRLGGPKQRRAGPVGSRVLGGVPRVPRHGRWGGAHPTHPVTAPWYPSSTLRAGGGSSVGGGSFPGFGKGVGGSRAGLRASDRAWEAHRRGFVLASAASNARDFAASKLAIDVRGDATEHAAATPRGSVEHEVQYTVEIPPSAAKTADSRPTPTRKSLLDEEESPDREKAWNDEARTSADDVSVRSEREKAASVMSVAASMLDFDGEDDKDSASAAVCSDDSDDDLFAARVKPSVRVKPAITAVAKGGDDSDSDDDDWMFRGKGVKA